MFFLSSKISHHHMSSLKLDFYKLFPITDFFLFKAINEVLEISEKSNIIIFLFNVTPTVIVLIKDKKV